MREQNQQQAPQIGPDESDLNSKLKKRLWIAGGLVAVAVAAIPLMDALTKPKVEMSSDAPTPSSGKIVKPASSPEAGIITPPKIASAPAQQSSAPTAEAGNGAPVAPAANPPTTPDLSKTPAIANQQAASRHPPPPHATAPSQTQPASKAASLERETPPSKTASARQPSTPARSEAAAAPSMDSAAAPKVAPPAATIPPSPPAKAEPAGSSVGYQVQLGLFASMGNAQKLVKELQKHGIAAHTVTRVQVGPFKNRAEADEAMKKLRELGYAPLLAPNGQ